MTARPRLFVAVAVPGRVRAALAAAIEPVRREAPSLVWVPPERWHLTLAFIGPCDRPEVACDATAAAAGEVGPCTLALSGALGHFGQRVLWAGLAPSGALQHLAVTVRRRLSDAGVATDPRPFSAHLTLARARRGGRIPPGLPGRLVEGPEHVWTVDRVTLLASEFGSDGPRYRTVHAAALSGAR